MKKGILTVIVTLLASGYAGAAIEELTPQQVHQEASSGQVFIYDVNPQGIYEKHHVPNAQNVNFGNLVSLLPKEKNKRLIFYCMSGKCTSSHQAAEMAVKSGYGNVARMPSGISGWLNAGLPTQKM